jgi:hypothetical protein
LTNAIYDRQSLFELLSFELDIPKKTIVIFIATAAAAAAAAAAAIRVVQYSSSVSDCFILLFDLVISHYTLGIG